MEIPDRRAPLPMTNPERQHNLDREMGRRARLDAPRTIRHPPRLPHNTQHIQQQLRTEWTISLWPDPLSSLHKLPTSRRLLCCNWRDSCSCSFQACNGRAAVLVQQCSAVYLTSGPERKVKLNEKPLFYPCTAIEKRSTNLNGKLIEGKMKLEVFF